MGNRAVAAVARRPDRFATVTFTDGSTGVGTCLHCPDAPCVQFSDAEVDADVGISSNHYPSKPTCIFGAITWDPDQHVPVVDPDACIGCGVCLGRCPVGAIRLDEGVAEVLTGASEVFELRSDCTREEFGRLQADLRDAAAPACSNVASNLMMEQMPVIARSLQTKNDAGLSYRLLARNLLLTLGTPAKAAPPGNTNFRVELVFRERGGPALAEVDSGDAMLDAIRRLLADYAIVRNGRYGDPPRHIGAFLVCAEFPNKRVDMYEVIGNIREFLGFEIQTLPLAMLVILAGYGFPVGELDFAGKFLLSRKRKHLIGDTTEILGGCMPDNPGKHFGAGDLKAREV